MRARVAAYSMRYDLRKSREIARIRWEYRRVDRVSGLRRPGSDANEAGSRTAASINANIEANYLNTSSTTLGNIKRVRTTGTATTSFAGFLKANEVESDSGTAPKGIDISKSLTAAITIENDVKQRIVVRGASSGAITIRGNATRRIEAWEGFSGAIVIEGNLTASLIAGREPTSEGGMITGQSFSSITIGTTTTPGSFIATPENSTTTLAPYIVGGTTSEISARRGTISSLVVHGDVRPGGATPPIIVAKYITHLTVDGNCLAYVGTGMKEEGTSTSDREVRGGDWTEVGGISVGGLMAGRYAIKTTNASTVYGAQGFSGSLDVTENTGSTVPATSRRFRFGRGLTGAIVYRDS